MSPVIIAVVVALVLVLGGWLVLQRQRTRQLHTRYGPEYDRTVADLGRRRAEAELASRERRIKQLDIRPLTAEQRQRFAEEWRTVQARFVDDPPGAVTQSDHLVEEVMKTRGYPVADFEQRVADLSVHHARLVEKYRSASEVAFLHRRGEASTEDLRQAMVYYRELFEDLLDEHVSTDRKLADREVDRRIERERVTNERAAEAIAARANLRRVSDTEVRP
jgi:hypothetical protein